MLSEAEAVRDDLVKRPLMLRPAARADPRRVEAMHWRRSPGRAVLRMRAAVGSLVMFAAKLTGTLGRRDPLAGLCAMLVCVALVLGLAPPAAAAVQLKCGSWSRLSADQKLATIDRAIEDLISGSRGREYTSVNRIQTGRCLENHRSQIVDDFNELCSRGMRTGLDSLNETFRFYVWSCAQ